ncbi:MAG: hypothetical protein ACRERE_41720 [Candidatus Entotheonellia bacterium]
MSRGHVRLVRCELALLLAGAALASDVSGFDVSRYRPSTIQAMIRDLPAPAQHLVAQELPIRSRVTYAGEFRELPEDSREHIRVWADLMHAPEAPRVFARELKVYEGGTAYWFPVQEVLVPAMRSELRLGQRIEVFMIYIGHVRGRHVFLINAFDDEP